MSEERGPISLLMDFGNLMGSLIIINLLFIVFSIPVITIGPALCGLYKALLKLTREEGTPHKNFIDGFKSDFRQSLVAWIILGSLGAALWGNYVFFNATGDISGTVFILLLVIGFWVFACGIYTFPLIAQFKNKLFRTMRNALLLSVTNFSKTVLFLVLNGIVPVILIFNSDMFFKLLPLWLALGVSLPSYLCALILSKIFKPFMNPQSNQPSSNPEPPEED